MAITVATENGSASNDGLAASVNARMERFLKSQEDKPIPKAIPPWPSDIVKEHDQAIVRPPMTSNLQRQILEIAKHFSPGPSVHTLQAAAQRLAEADILHAHAVSLVEKMATLPWRDRRFGFNEWSGLASACELWEAELDA